eukprot:5648582-Amphidinium_carterae.1
MALFGILSVDVYAHFSARPHDHTYRINMVMSKAEPFLSLLLARKALAHTSIKPQWWPVLSLLVRLSQVSQSGLSFISCWAPPLSGLLRWSCFSLLRPNKLREESSGSNARQRLARVFCTCPRRSSSSSLERSLSTQLQK